MPQQDPSNWLQWASLIVGLIGGVTGVVGGLAAIGVWLIERRRDEVRLRVSAGTIAIELSTPEAGKLEWHDHLSATIVNLSSFPVFVGVVKLELADGTFVLSASLPVPVDSEPVARRLEAHESMLVYWPRDMEQHPNWPDIRGVHVLTECGTTARATSAQFTNHVRSARGGAAA